MGRRLILCLCGASLVAGAQATSAAGAELPYFAHHLKLKSSNGFHISLSASSEALGNPAEVSIGVETRQSAALYRVPAKVTATGIQADLGPFGKVALAM